MYASTTFVLTAILALTRVAIATPPACLIAALGIQPNPSDLKALCGTLQDSVAGNITEKCSGDAGSAALSVYSATCLSSESVTISITTSAKSSTKTSVSATTTGSDGVKETGSPSSSGSDGTGSPSGGSDGTGSPSGGSDSTASVTGSPTGTSSGANASSTGNSAGSNSPQIALAVLAAGFVGQYLL